MDEIVNKFLLARDKFIPKIHLKQPGFTYSTCGPLTKNKERIQKLKETQEIQDIYIYIYIYIYKWTRQILLSAWYGLLRF